MQLLKCFKCGRDIEISLVQDEDGETYHSLCYYQSEKEYQLQQEDMDLMGW